MEKKMEPTGVQGFGLGLGLTLSPKPRLDCQ